MEQVEKKIRKADDGADMPVDPNQLKVNWETSKLKTSYANVCNVSSTREEITVLFGTNQTWQPGQKEVSVELTERVILSPFAAKRLFLVLKSVIDQYEARFGALAIEEVRK